MFFNGDCSVLTSRPIGCVWCVPTCGSSLPTLQSYSQECKSTAWGGGGGGGGGGWSDRLLLPSLCRNLYFGTIVVGCSLYLLCQLVCLFTSHCKAISYLMLAGLAGGGSLWLFYAHSCWLCWTLGAWSIEVEILVEHSCTCAQVVWRSLCGRLLQGVWYYWSDLSMLFIFYYAWHTRVRYVPVSSPDALLQGDE